MSTVSKFFPKVYGVLLALFLFSGPAFSQPVPGSAKITTPGGYQKLTSKVSQTGSVRLIVKVDVPFQPMARPESQASRFQMGRIASAQDSLLSNLAAFHPKASHKYRYTPYLFMEVDEKALKALLASPLVADVQEDMPHFPSLDGVTRIGAPQSWDLYGGQGFDGTGVVVAILDTGVDKDHPFLNGAMVSEACYSTNSTNVESLCPAGVPNSTAAGSALPYGDPAGTGICPTGKCDHGTHVAGIIAGRRDVAGAPLGGVAPGASLIAIQVFSLFTGAADCSPHSAPCVMAYTSDIMQGLERVYDLKTTYAIASVNMSFGGSLYSTNCDTDPTKPIIDSLRAEGVASVISSANNGSCNSISAPACISTAVSVGATDVDGSNNDVVASYSNSASFMSLLAPGSNITSSVPGGTYASWSGTSMAAPHVSGAWALIKQAKPGATVDEVLAAFSSAGPSVTDSRCVPSVTKDRISVFDSFSILGSGPSAETKAATNITQAAAVLNGTVNANNADASVTFEYGTTTSYGSSVDSVPGTVAGTALTHVSQTITGLDQNTLYHYRVKAAGISGTAYGNDMTFITSGLCASIVDGSFEGGTPNTSWAEASTLFGTPLCNYVTCPGKAARAGLWFAQFGGILAPETSSLSQNMLIPAGCSPRLEFYLNLPVPSSGNNADDFKVLVDNVEIYSVVEGSPVAAFYGGGYLLTALDLSAYADDAPHSLSFLSTVTGTGAVPTTFLLDDVSVTCGKGTMLPVVATDAATSITTAGATLSGTVNANNTSTTVTFEYGTTPSYGNSLTAAPANLTGSSDTAVSARLSGLTPGTTYHYRVVGSSLAGLAYGGDMMFKWCTAEEIMINGTPYPDPSIQSAILSIAGSNATIQVKTGDFPENLLFQGTGTVELKGGYDCVFASNPNFITVSGADGTSGSITIKGTGAVILGNIIIQ